MSKGIERPDEVYEALIELHRDLDDASSRRIDARLILLLAAEIGNADTLKRLIAAAREEADAGRGASSPTHGR
ncbi:MAG: DUF2783 domain-containing protein [Alphaproteobacteria bacterium]|nr:DUF2783 domain-containing protein [Alphaproteobacteria bacterium]